MATRTHTSASAVAPRRMPSGRGLVAVALAARVPGQGTPGARVQGSRSRPLPVRLRRRASLLA